MKFIESGTKFNRWTIIKFQYLKVYKTHTKKFYLCRCDCGKLKEIEEATLKNGMSKSCGCWKREVDINRHYIHGQSYNRIYSVWKNMRRRCYNPKHKKYKYYGGRGISVYKEWNLEFNNFWLWARKNGYKDTLFLDRIDNDGNYEPNNCRFVDWSTQVKNRRVRKNIK